MSGKSSNAPISLSSFDINKLIVEEKKATNNNIELILLKYFKGTAKQAVKIQTPEMYTMFGLSNFGTIDLSFRDKEYNQSLSRFFDFLLTLDNWLIQYMEKKSKEIFGEDFTESNLREMQNPSIKYSYQKDNKGNKVLNNYPPSFRLNCSKKNNKYPFPTYNERMETLDLDTEKTKNTFITGLMILNGIWINKSEKSFGFVWKVHQLRINHSKTQENTSYEFEFDEDEDRLVGDTNYDDDGDSEEKKRT